MPNADSKSCKKHTLLSLKDIGGLASVFGSQCLLMELYDGLNYLS